MIAYVSDRKGHDQRYAIDSSKAMKELSWAPTTMFKDGIKLTIKWYKEHMDRMAECTSGDYMKYCEQMYGKRRGFLFFIAALRAAASVCGYM